MSNKIIFRSESR